MAIAGNHKGFEISEEGLPASFPTHGQNPKFWELLGRTVAAFGFLEEVLGKAIFAIAATQHSKAEMHVTLTEWSTKLGKAQTDPLQSLIDSFVKDVRAHNSSVIDDEQLNTLRDDLGAASKIRNLLCHASWKPTDDPLKSRPFYKTKQKIVVPATVDLAYLQKASKDATNLAIHIINAITHMGYQFPGTTGPGKPIWE